MQECKKIIKLWNRSKSKRWNCVSLTVMFLRFHQQATERAEFINFLWAKLFSSNPNVSVSVISWLINTRSTASTKNDSENMNWLSLAFLPQVHWKIELDFRLEFSAAIGKHVTTVGWSPLLNTWCKINSRLNSAFEKLPKNVVTSCLVYQIFAVFFSKLLQQFHLTNTGTEIHFSQHDFASRFE